MDKEEDVRANPTALGTDNITDASIEGVLEKNTSQWETIWRCTDDTKRNDAIAMLKALRTIAIDEPGTPIVFCSGHIRKVAHSFPNKTSIGADCWTFQEIAACVDEDLEALGRLMADNI